MTEQELFETIRRPHVWPGGYRRHLIMADGEPVCTRCAESNKPAMLRAMAYPGTDDQWCPIATEVNWEDEHLLCAHCDERIESVYGGDDD